MDNYNIDITAESRKTLEAVLEICFNHNAPGQEASHYIIKKLKKESRYYGSPETTHHFTDWVEAEDGMPTLILLWSNFGRVEGVEKFAYPMDLEEVQKFVEGWLKRADLGREPDHDGSNGRGFRIFTDYWGHVEKMSAAICGIQPAWAMYGK